MRFLIIILLSGWGMCLAQRGMIKETHCFTSNDIDTNLLKEEFLKEMESNVLFIEDYYKSKAWLDSAIKKKMIIDDSIAPEAYLALAFFPELFDKEIRVKYARINGTMNARPDLINFFRNKDNRRYILLINNNKGRHKGLKLNDISFNARVGWFGHEFAHLFTYQQMNNWQTIKFIIKYLISNKFIRKTERYTNTVAIERGLIFQVYQGEQFILLNNALSDDYRRRTIYRSLSYKEYICLWNQYNNKGYRKTASKL